MQTPLLLLLVACASGAFVTHASLSVDPTLTDPLIHRGRLELGFGDHLAAWRAGSTGATSRLAVFLPGTFGSPSGQTFFLNAAADAGFLAIGLAYQNNKLVETLCGNSTPGLAFQQCNLAARREAITGQELSSVIEVSVADSIVNRLLKMLVYMHAQQPTRGWDSYYEGSTLLWSRMVFAGHSQGAGTAQVVAMDYPVQRAARIAGGVNLDATTIPAIGNTWSFAHTGDPLFSGAMDSTYFAMGAGVSVDSASPPYSGSQRITTSLAASGEEHGVVVVDDKLQFQADGTPVYQEAWKYILGDSAAVQATTTVSPGASTTIPATTAAGSEVSSASSSLVAVPLIVLALLLAG